MTVREAWLSDVDDIAPLFNAYRMFYEQPSDLNGAKVWIRDNMTLKRATLFVCQESDESVGVHSAVSGVLLCRDGAVLCSLRRLR